MATGKAGLILGLSAGICLLAGWTVYGTLNSWGQPDRLETEMDMDVQAGQEPESDSGLFPKHEPYGAGIGVMPGRVAWVYNPESVSWDGNGWWWLPEHFDEAVMFDMVNKGIASLAGKEDAESGWNALFQTYNKNHGNGENGYTAGERLVIKANINGSGLFDDDASGETQMSYTNPVLLRTLLLSLTETAGVPAEAITVYDVSRIFPDYMTELCGSGSLQGVRFVDRRNAEADYTEPIRWSYEFAGDTNYLPVCVTEADYMINLANLKGHSYGITLCGKNHFGSYLNNNKLRPPEGANLHGFMTGSEMGVYSPLVDFMANEQLGGKTMLYLLDAFICAPSEGASISGNNSRWRQAPFNGGYTSSVFLSQDPVAIDSVGADFLASEPVILEHNRLLGHKPSVENYLHEASLAEAAPSGIRYQNGSGEPVLSLGVHEHWNNPKDRQYSRNLGKDEGIELVFTDTR